MAPNRKITDKQRLDWLTKNSDGMEHVGTAGWVILFSLYMSEPCKSPREAIDAAILAEHKLLEDKS